MWRRPITKGLRWDRSPRRTVPAVGFRRVLDLLTKQSAEFKEQFGKAVSEVAPPPTPQPAQPTWGTVRIDNRMLSSQYIEINGFGRWVSPLSYIDVTVPAGWATVRLVEYEVAKNWWVGAPSYFQTVIIDRQPSYVRVIW